MPAVKNTSTHIRVKRFLYFYRVKFLTLLLSIIVLTLTTVPCCALEQRDSHAHQKVQEKEHGQCPEQENECCKDCSPFYVCGTCIGFTATTQTLIVFTISIKPVQHNTFYLPIALSPISTLIWQPPKLS